MRHHFYTRIGHHRVQTLTPLRIFGMCWRKLYTAFQAYRNYATANACRNQSKRWFNSRYIITDILNIKEKYLFIVYAINIHYCVSSVKTLWDINILPFISLHFVFRLLNIMSVHLNWVPVISCVGSMADVALLPDPKSVCQRHHPLVQEFNSSGQ